MTQEEINLFIALIGPPWETKGALGYKLLSEYKALLWACRRYQVAIERIHAMNGWAEGECDLWAGPELQIAEDIGVAAIAKAEGKDHA